MKPNTEMTRACARSQARMDRERIFAKSHIALAVALLTSLAASAPAQSEVTGSREPDHIALPARTRVVDGDGMSCNQYSVEVNGVKYACPDAGSLNGFNIVAFYRSPQTDPNELNKKPTLREYSHATIHTDNGLQPVKTYLDDLLTKSETM